MSTTAKKQTDTTRPLTLKEWIFPADGKHIKELIQISFLEFYLAKKTTEIRQNA